MSCIVQDEGPFGRAPNDAAVRGAHRGCAEGDGPRRSGRSRLQMLRDLLEYRRAGRRIGRAAEELDCLFRRFLAAGVGRRCVRITVDGGDSHALGKNWVTMDLARQADRGPMALTLGDEQIDAVFCTGLERVAQPASLIAEAWRVLRQAGQIWIEVPLNAPRRRDRAEYWHVTPEGLRLLMGSFDEIHCDAYLRDGSALRSTSFFYGMKPTTPSPDAMR